MKKLQNLSEPDLDAVLNKIECHKDIWQNQIDIINNDPNEDRRNLLFFTEQIEKLVVQQKQATILLRDVKIDSILED